MAGAKRGYGTVNVDRNDDVFCKNCMWIHYNFFDSSIATCQPEYMELEKDPVNGERYVTKQLLNERCSTRNENYTCKYYQKKSWWNFWN